MTTVRNLMAFFVLVTMTLACGFPVPFEWSSQPTAANVDELLSGNTFTVPEGQDAQAARDLIQQYLGEYADEENWPDGLDDLKLDVPLLETFPVDLSTNPQVSQAAGTLSAVAVDRLELQFLANSVNYAIPSFHFFTVDDGVTLPEADAFDMSNLPAGVKQIGTMTGVDAKSTGSFQLVYTDEGKQLLSDALKALKFNIAIFTELTFDTQQDGGLVPSGAVEVQAHLAGRFLSDN